MQIAQQALWQAAHWRTELPVQAGVSRSFSRYARDGFNLALHVADDPERVRDNRARLAEVTSLSGTWMWLDQKHGVEVVADDGYTAGCSADAVISRTPKKIAVVMTADCVPILLSAVHGAEVAAVHAGWPGLATHILARTLSRMHTPTEAIFAWIGPCIRQMRYEVDESFRARFVTIDSAYHRFFVANRTGHFLADLPGIARHQLACAGIPPAHIADCSLCTSNDPGFFSYRRDGSDAGRIASFINPTQR